MLFQGGTVKVMVKIYYLSADLQIRYPWTGDKHSVSTVGQGCRELLGGTYTRYQFVPDTEDNKLIYYFLCLPLMVMAL